MKLLNIEETRIFLRDFAASNELNLAFICTPEGGLICASRDSDNGIRMDIEALSALWQTILPPQWKRTYFHCVNDSHLVLVNAGSWIFGLKNENQNPTTIGLLHLKAKICADHIAAQLQ
jgi:hypothetical protein